MLFEKIDDGLKGERNRKEGERETRKLRENGTSVQVGGTDSQSESVDILENISKIDRE